MAGDQMHNKLAGLSKWAEGHPSIAWIVILLTLPLGLALTFIAAMVMVVYMAITGVK